MRIAIFNEDKKYLCKLKQMIYRYAEKFKIEILIECFNCGNDLLASKNRYHIAFLDYKPINNNGLLIADKLTEKNCFCSIIFTGYKHCFDNSIFAVDISGFLTYPLKESEVEFVLNNYFRKRKNGYPLFIKSGTDTVCLNTNEIVYIEANNKRCVVHLKKESIDCNKTMANVYETLPKRLFLKINRSYVINSDYVNRFNSDEVMLKTGQRLYISRNYRKIFKENYYDFINEMIV